MKPLLWPPEPEEKTFPPLPEEEYEEDENSELE
jgi:hypothetical protein